MTIKQLNFNKKSKKKRKRVGRGNASGLGGECGRGHKGQKSRSGFSHRFGFEGGRTPLYRQLPKSRGFTNKFKSFYAVVSLKKLNDSFNDGELVDLESLHRLGLIKKNQPYKILTNGNLEKKLKIKTFRISKSAQVLIEKSGSSLEIYS